MQRATRSKSVGNVFDHDEFDDPSGHEYDNLIAQISDAQYEALSTPSKNRKTGRQRSESPTPAQGTKGKRQSVNGEVFARSNHGPRERSTKPIPKGAPLGKALSWNAQSEISSAFLSAAGQPLTDTSRIVQPKPMKEYTIPDSDDDHGVSTDVDTDNQSTSSRSTSSIQSTPFTSPDTSASSAPFAFTPLTKGKGKAIDWGHYGTTTPTQPQLGESISSAPRPFSNRPAPGSHHVSKPSGAAASSSSRDTSQPSGSSGSKAETAAASQTPTRPKLNVHPSILPRASRPAPPPPPAVKAPVPLRNAVDSLAVSLSKLEISNTLSSSCPTNEDLIQDFLSLPLGRALNAHVIAHNQKAQRALDKARVEWGTQWELARGVTRGLWTWEEVITKAGVLGGPNKLKAGDVPRILGKAVTSSTAYEVWNELDREEKATREDPDRRLGLKGAYEGDANWHGGRVQQIIRLVKVDNKVGQYKIALEPMERRRSHRFARYMGSRRILQLRVSDKAFMNEKDKVVEFLSKKFVLLGRVFVPFHSKDGSVYMVETDEDYEREPQDWCADNQRISFVEFMEWHNPLLYNSRQAISKYVTRFALGLSNSIPVLEFQSDSIFFIDDIYASDWPVGKPGAPAEKIMTDGCGFMNLSALQKITRFIGYEYLPTSVQGRVDGAKGLWIRHPYDESDEPRIWIRASQNKIKNPSLDRAHRIFELLTPSKPSVGDALSQQSILNLQHNGVPAENLIKLFEEGLREQVEPLLNWDNLVLLYHAVGSAGGVAGTRMARLAAMNSRAFGLERQQWGNEEVDADDDDEEKEDTDLGPATYTGRNPYSAAPASLHESIMELLQAGFKPHDFKPLQDDIKKAATMKINTSIEKYRIPLKESMWAFVIPDPFAISPLSHPTGPATVDSTGLLEPGQIYFRSSIPMKDPKTDMPYHVVVGEVVVGRYPIRLPSDMQRVTAVDVPELAGWTDVVIISAKGDRSLANLLSGGDMDGDTVHIFREPEIVESFKRENPLSEPPEDLMEDFEQEVESVESFCKRMLSLPKDEAAKSYQDVLLSNVKASNKGLYSMFHDQAVARYGYDDRRAIRLAYIFTTLLDASKSGLRLKPGVFEKDQAEYGKTPEPFGVLSALKEEGSRLLDEYLQRLESACQSGSDKDPGLLAPYDGINNYILQLTASKSPATSVFHNELSAIRKHVQNAKDIFDQSALKSKNRPPSASKARAKTRNQTKADQDDIMLDAAREFQKPIPGISLITNVEEIKASYAYHLVREAKGRFPWSVAFSTLCRIKAEATAKNGQYAPVLYQFDECKNISSAVVRIYAKAAEQEVF